MLKYSYMMQYKLAKPFIKWAGGKSQLLDQFQKFYPILLKENKIDYYYEPFLGGGAVFFDIIQKYDIKKAYLIDINEDLILTYLVIQNYVYDLIQNLKELEQQYKKLSQEKRKIFYYKIRKSYNENKSFINYKKFHYDWIERAAQMIFLNKTCYNGLYRLNSSGEFNSPAGNYKNPTILDEENLIYVSKILQKAEIYCSSYKLILKLIKKNSFVYFDPPYRPISTSSNFVKYTQYGFSEKDQIELSRIYKKLDKKNIYLMLSNSDPKNTNPHDKFFENLYQGYFIDKIYANRMINCQGDKRGKIQEIIIRNYSL
ncbi:MAG: restriction endonuclease subunit M [Leptospiraceae bacterium]|nr:MAG: restriction endonuclease subunit M [Leptospiraceae bacterium]